MNPKIQKVKPEGNYTLRLWFTNGEERIFDVKPYLNDEVFQPLKNKEVFDTATQFLGSITWSNNSDLSYDTLYLESLSV
jgi:DUF971 family protein